MNTYDTIKRSVTQLLNKGVVYEAWDVKGYCDSGHGDERACNSCRERERDSTCGTLGRWKECYNPCVRCFR